MDRYAIFVDAGYVHAAGGMLVHGNTNRSYVEIDYEEVVALLQSTSESLVRGADLLRIYWYDAAINGVPQQEHLRIASVPGVKLRLGRLTRTGQKGVDSLVVRDMMRLAAGHAICTALLFSGDEDLRQGVVEAQDDGVKVILLGIEPSYGQNQSDQLVREADVHRVFTLEELTPCFRLREEPYRERVPAAIEDSTFDAFQSGYRVGLGWSREATADGVAEITRDGIIPKDVDAVLIRTVVEDAGLPFGAMLEQWVLGHAREGFRTAIQAPLGPEITAPTAAPAPEGEAFAAGRRFAEAWTEAAAAGASGAILAGYPIIPRELDADLLRTVVGALGLPFGMDVGEELRKEARAGFWTGLGLTPRIPAEPPAARPVIAEEDPFRWGQAFGKWWIRNAAPDLLERTDTMARARLGLPAEVDRELLSAASEKFGYPVDHETRREVRAGFEQAFGAL